MLEHNDADRRSVMIRDELGSSGVAVATRRTKALTERQVAEQLGLSVATLRAWRHRGKGPRFLRLGRSVRYLPADVDEFVRASAVDTQSELGELHV
jgi:excisionase family DNA binding protein